MSNLYVVGHDTDTHTYVKVGMTTRCVTKRCGDWDTGSPWDWVIHFDLQVPNEHKSKLRTVERKVHSQLFHTGRHVRHEWFDANAYTVIGFIAYALAEEGIDPTECVLHRSTPDWEMHWDALANCAKRECA